MTAHFIVWLIGVAVLYVLGTLLGAFIYWSAPAWNPADWPEWERACFVVFSMAWALVGVKAAMK